MTQTLTLPGLDSGDVSDTGSEVSAPATKFPHTRAQLVAIARQHRPLDGYENDNEADDPGRVDSAYVAKVVGLLDGEHEDELKSLLKSTYNVHDETVSLLLL
jgi:hypothetical protein